MAYIVLSILGVAAVLLVKSKSNGLMQLLYISLVILIGSIALSLTEIMLSYNTITKGNNNIISLIPWYEIILYFAMLFGMASKYFYDAIGAEKKVLFQKWQFIKPILISPIVFGIIYSTKGEGSSLLLLVLFSFQNGFFWQTVLEKPK